MPALKEPLVQPRFFVRKRSLASLRTQVQGQWEEIAVSEKFIMNVPGYWPSSFTACCSNVDICCSWMCDDSVACGGHISSPNRFLAVTNNRRMFCRYGESMTAI